MRAAGVGDTVCDVLCIDGSKFSLDVAGVELHIIHHGGLNLILLLAGQVIVGVDLGPGAGLAGQADQNIDAVEVYGVDDALNGVTYVHSEAIDGVNLVQLELYAGIVGGFHGAGIAVNVILHAAFIGISGLAVCELVVAVGGFIVSVIVGNAVEHVLDDVLGYVGLQTELEPELCGVQGHDVVFLSCRCRENAQGQEHGSQQYYGKNFFHNGFLSLCYCGNGDFPRPATILLYHVASFLEIDKVTILNGNFIAGCTNSGKKRNFRASGSSFLASKPVLPGER